VVIGHDITVRRNDDAAAKSVFYLRTTSPLLWAEAKRPKEALELILLTAGNEPKLAELFARAELRRGSCVASAKSTKPAGWVTGAENPRLRGTI
jgi:hypothetical protein